MNRKVFGQVNKSLTQIITAESWSLSPFQDLSQLTDPEPLKGRGYGVVLKDIFTLQTEKPRIGKIKQIVLSFKENTR